jgi:hypothetical protein
MNLDAELKEISEERQSGGGKGGEKADVELVKLDD